MSISEYCVVYNKEGRGGLRFNTSLDLTVVCATIRDNFGYKPASNLTFTSRYEAVKYGKKLATANGLTFSDDTFPILDDTI